MRYEVTYSYEVRCHPERNEGEDPIPQWLSTREDGEEANGGEIT